MIPSLYNKQPSSVVELSISCEDLPSLDLFSKSDPMVVLYLDQKGSGLVEIGRTEMIKNNNNPNFKTQIKVQYYFELIQNLVFRIYDVDDKKGNLATQDYVGEVQCTMAQIVSSLNGQFCREISNVKQPTRKSGKLVVSSVEISRQERIHLQFHAKNLDKKDFFGKSDPYLNIYRIVDLNITPPKLVLVHQTEVIKNNLNPTWAPIDLEINKLILSTSSDAEYYNNAFYVECFDWDANSSPDLIGSAKIILSDLWKSGVPFTVDLVNPDKAAKKSKYKNSGQLFATKVEILKDYSFLDYLSTGTEVSFGVAIDFTASNGDPRNPNSLHYLSPNGEFNSYMRAIWSVGHVVMPYDADKNFPVFGFGAKLPPSWQVYHDFNANLNPSSPVVYGIDGILSAYQQCIRSVELYGPTNFSPIIKRMAIIANEHAPLKYPSKYFVLVIITDGEITDLEETKQAIVDACELPLSIVIIGVGNADFSCMNELDSDGEPLRSRNGVATRDIVQFVPIRNYTDPVYGSDLLAKDVLAEIPNQLVGYMKKKGIKPIRQ